jgi:hypothetical protein
MKNFYLNLQPKAIYLMLFIVGFCSLQNVNAQQKINASDIMKDLKSGKTIAHKDAIIVGVLDFTFMDDKMPNLDKKYKWWGGSDSNAITEVIESKISFVNCTFDSDVIAYFHDDRTEYTFEADFERSVQFENCTFRENSMFKYSNFESYVSFKGSDFQEETTFKYAEFEDDVDFSNTIFDEEATFKYSKFSHKADFANATFDKDASFKYSNFREGVTFNNTKFNRSLDLKYTKVTGEFDIDKMKVRDDIDSKYTSINGDGLTRYMLNKRD